MSDAALEPAPAAPPSVEAILATVDRPASYLAAARQLAALVDPPLVEVRLAVLASYTFDLVAPYLVVEGARRGLAITATMAPFGQLEQQVLAADSALHAARPTAILIATRIEELAPELADGFVRLTGEAIDAAIDAYVARLDRLLRALRERTTAHLLVTNQAPPLRLAAGLADTSLERGQQLALAQLGDRLTRMCAAIPGAGVLDLARVAAEVGTLAWYDAKLAHLARCPLSGAAQLALGRRVARHLRALVRPPAKCLVLDLDNTLWGGVLGEDGVGGIALGDEYPGSAFKEFQRVLRSYRDRGVLLAIASKNNEADVLELFASHPDLELRLEHFAARQLHWNDKASSLRAIADELNLGVDALAFFDDNPVERAWVREQLPEVHVVDVPRDPLRYVAALDDAGLFDHLVITAEDRRRAEQYQNEVRRRDLEHQSGSVEDFLRALDMKVTIGAIDAATLPRVVQLLGKTNQFNVTTRRHGESELAAMLRDGAIGLWMRVADRYGDHGLVGVAIAAPTDGAAFRVDTFLMSCRVLGRQAEDALLHVLATRVAGRGATALLGEFIPSKKNAPAAGFFAGAGFAAIADRPGWWRLALADRGPGPTLFEIVEES
jgi:FkbH-like protein